MRCLEVAATDCTLLMRNSSAAASMRCGGSRDMCLLQIAEICLQAALDPAGSNKVVEASTEAGAPVRLLSDQLAAI